MPTKTQQSAVDRASEKLQELVVIAGESTGVFSDYADEHLTVHIGGNTLEYVPRDTRVDHRTDPVLRFTAECDYLRIRRTSKCHKQTTDGEMKRFPAFTIEVDEA